MHCEYFLLKGIMSQDFGPFFEKKNPLFDSLIQNEKITQNVNIYIHLTQKLNKI